MAYWRRFLEVSTMKRNPCLLFSILFILFSLIPAVYPDTPKANAGGEVFATRYIRIGHIAPSTRVELDASGSYDPGGEPLNYSWTLSPPAGSNAQLYDSDSATPSFYADLQGEYTVQLLVSHGSFESPPDTITIEAVHRDVETINWGNPYFDGGFDIDCLTPEIAMNDAGVVVEVHEGLGSRLYYRVGVRQQGGAIDWGDITRYNEGHFPSVAINNEGIVVEAHQAANWDPFHDYLYYLVGEVDEDTKTITFLPSERYTEGFTPSIAVNDDSVVVAVHSAKLDLNVSQLYYKVGTILDNGKINFGDSKHYNNGWLPSISINNHGFIVEAHQELDVIDGDLHSSLGKVLPDEERIAFNGSKRYSEGYMPSIAINDDGMVAEVHSGKFLTDLYYKLGTCDGITLDWHDAESYAVGGLTPSVALNNNYEFLEIDYYLSISGEDGLNGLLYHSTSDFMPARNSRNWMTLTPSVQCRTLKDAYLPGTHDSAAYDFVDGFYSPNYVVALEVIATLLRNAGLPFFSDQVEASVQAMAQAQDKPVLEQLNSGIRFLDLRIYMHIPPHAPYDKWGNFYVHHSAVGRELWEILDDIRLYMESVEGENELLVIQGWVNSQSLEIYDHHRLLAGIQERLGSYLYKRDVGFVDETQIETLMQTPIRDIVKDGSKIVFVYKDSGDGFLELIGESHPEMARLFWPPLDFNKWPNSNRISKVDLNQSEALLCFLSEYCENDECDDEMAKNKLCDQNICPGESECCYKEDVLTCEYGYNCAPPL